MEKLQIIGAALLLLGLAGIVNMVRRRKLELKYALSWIVVLLLVLAVDLAPGILNIISYCFGIATPVNTLFLLALCFTVLLIFVLTVAVSRMAERLRQLSQAVALSEEKIRILEEKIKGVEAKHEEDHHNGM